MTNTPKAANALNKVRVAPREGEEIPFLQDIICMLITHVFITHHSYLLIRADPPFWISSGRGVVAWF